MSPTGFEVRACEFRDLGQVARLEKASFPELPYTRLDFAYYLFVAREGFKVASKEGKVVGYVIALSNGKEGTIQSIAVLPGFRETGLGEALMRAALEHLAGKAERVRLLVSAENLGAVRLYKKLAFEETGKVVKGYYPDGSDAVEMARRL